MKQESTSDSYPLSYEQIHHLLNTVDRATNNNHVAQNYHRNSMSRTLWYNSDFMVDYALEEQRIKECYWILIRKLSEV